MSSDERPGQSERPPSEVRLALLQLRCVDSQPANIDKALLGIAQAASEGANIVCLPELFGDLYPCQSEDHRRFDQAEPIPGPITELLGQAAREHEVVVIGSLFERRGPGVYHNTAVVLDADGRLLGRYRKMHVPDDPLYYEKFYFAPGDLGFPSFPTRFGRIGVCVCWDQWFPEAARLLAMSGAQIIFYPTAIGWAAHEKLQFGASQHSAWETMMRSHAIANGVFVAAVNRTGQEGGLEFWGASFACDPNGNVLARASHEEEQTLLVRCNLDQIEAARTHWPFFRDRRIDAYSDLTKRYLDDS